METFKFDEEALRKIDKNKLELISRMFADLQKKSAEERLQCMFTYGLEMRSKGLHFTKEESGMLMEMLKSNLSEAEKAKIDMLSGMMRSM